MFPHHLYVAGEIVFLLLPVRSLPAGPVEPDAEQLAVLCEQLLQLVAIVIIVLRRAVIGAVPVPGGEIDPEAQTLLLTGLGRLPYHVPFAGGILHAVLRVLGGPQAEPVVVLGRQYHPLHPRIPHCPGPLAAVQLLRIEDALVFRSVSPLPVGVGVHAEMHECVEACVEPRQLPL